MAIAVSHIDTLQQYINGVLARANHHARYVNEIGLAIIGAIVARKDPDQPIEVRERDGQMKNVLFVVIGGERYALTHNREDRCIDIREGNTRGQTLAQFNNDSTIAAVWRFFAGL
jgi:hypothetical protein